MLACPTSRMRPRPCRSMSPGRVKCECPTPGMFSTTIATPVCGLDLDEVTEGRWSAATTAGSRAAPSGRQSGCTTYSRAPISAAASRCRRCSSRASRRRRVGHVAEPRVAEGSMHGVRQAGGERCLAVTHAEQRVQAEGADLGRRAELGDALESRREQQLREGAGRDADVGWCCHTGQVLQMAARMAAGQPDGFARTAGGHRPPMAAATDQGSTSYARLAALPLRIDGYDIERRELDVSSGFLRVTTTVVLRGGGAEGRGEDVTYAAEDHDGYPLHPPLAGDWTVDTFSRQVGGLELFPSGPPKMESFRPYRRWAFESAALDLALRQQGQSLGAALGRSYRPVRFALSTRLDVRPWLKVDPELEFKLDPTPEWDAVLVERVAASGRVRVLDFKAFYEGSIVDNPPDALQYRDGRRGVPGRDPRGPGTRGAGASRARWPRGPFQLRRADPLLDRRRRDHHGGCSALMEAALRHLNIKPSRFGSVGALLYCVERAQAAGMELYGGGQFELGVGRAQIEALASLFYPDGPNDVAPREYHGEARAGVCPAARSSRSSKAPGFDFVFRT